MPKALCTVFGFCTALSAAADLAEAEPTILTAQDMDAITAGVEVNVDGQANASGAFTHINTQTAAIASARQGNHPSIVATAGAAGGSASAAAVGDDASTGTSVSTSGEADGTFTVERTVNWTMDGPSGSVSGGFTWVSGRTGAFLLGGP